MEHPSETGQALIDFLLTTPEGRTALGAILTGLSSGVVRLLLNLSDGHWVENHEMARLEQQNELELEVERLKQVMLELGISIEEADEAGDDE